MKLKMILTARNIVNQEVIKDFISEVSKDQDDRIKSWCNSILKNYLKNEYPNLKDITRSKKNDPEWLKLAVQNKDAQEIVITDEFKRNLLEHIFPYFRTLTGNIKHSFSEAEKKTKEWDDRKSKFNIKLTKGVKEILKCDNGYTWFEITDEETLYNEGEVIQNCLRKDQHGLEYWKAVKDNEIKIFTLRDNKGIGHVGVEYNINDDKIYQMLGKQNKRPIEIYHTFCLELIKYLKCKIVKDITKFLNIIVDNRIIYDLYNLPENLDIKGSLLLSQSDIQVLPKYLKVGKDLDLSFSDIRDLPDILEVEHNLNLSNTAIEKFPSTLIVGNLLDLSYTLIEKLSKNLTINGYLNLEGSEIKILPDNLSLRALTLRSSKIKILPKNLKVSDLLNISDTKITKLPSDLKVGERLIISSTKIKELPKNLSVKSLEMYETLIKEIPDSLTAKEIFVDVKKRFTLKYNEKFKKIIKFF